MANYEHHIKSTTHRDKVQRFMSRLADEEHMMLGLEANGPNAPTPTSSALMESGPFFEPDPNPAEIIPDPPSPLTILRSLDSTEPLRDGLAMNATDFNDADDRIRFDMLRQALENLENLELEDDDDDECEEEEPQDPALARARAQEAHDWHPFKNKEVSNINTLPSKEDDN